MNLNREALLFDLKFGKQTPTMPKFSCRSLAVPPSGISQRSSFGSGKLAQTKLANQWANDSCVPRNVLKFGRTGKAFMISENPEVILGISPNNRLGVVDYRRAE